MKRSLLVCGLVAAVAMTVAVTPALAVERVTASEKGSLLIYSKVELRWDAAGNLIQDTFIDLTNDYPGDVCVQMYFINGDAPLPADGAERAHPGWNYVDVGICLTANQPTYWAASNGQPATSATGGGVVPFTILDPGFPPGRPDPVPGSTDRVMRGYIAAWAVDANSNEIRWNHLKGDAVIVNYMLGTAWEYTTWAFQAVTGANGDPLPSPGILNLDGTEYEPGFDLLILDFYAVGSSALSGPGNTVTVDTDLTLFPVDADLRQEGDGPVTTKANFMIWNMNEFKLSELDQCITCWDQRLLSQYGIPNNFLLNNLQTNKGKAQIQGLESQLCDLDFDPGDACTQNAGGPDVSCDPRDIESAAASLLGVAAKHLTFQSGDYGRAGMNLIGAGTQSATIYYDLTGGGNPPPERPEDDDFLMGPVKQRVTTTQVSR
jgi:hypothetical protein